MNFEHHVKFINRTFIGFENIRKTKICIHKNYTEYINNFDKISFKF